MLLEIDMNKVDYNKDFEHESTLNELLDLNSSYDLYYVADNDIIYLDNGSQLLDAYDYITDIFYLETDNLDINNLDSLSKCIEII
ncbi:hypothetical protein HOT02_gp206 [Staphylococcus phage phiSA_BS2]|nr:hypothetical protein HOT02_gp206 [Staphylococcus phage phiSA_BS2]AVR55650.1 hypothetical protein phiSABS2_206 [Staphylococcus phage phiSA_BS2]